MSEKVFGLEALKRWVRLNKFGYRPPCINAEELIEWAEKEAGKK